MECLTYPVKKENGETTCCDGQPVNVKPEVHMHISTREACQHLRFLVIYVCTHSSSGHHCGLPGDHPMAFIHLPELHMRLRILQTTESLTQADALVCCLRG